MWVQVAHTYVKRQLTVMFPWDASQAIAAGNAERLREFLEAGVEASSEYGAEEGCV